jgi:hypothetical protein
VYRKETASFSFGDDDDPSRGPGLPIPGGSQGGIVLVGRASLLRNRGIVTCELALAQVAVGNSCAR